MGEKNKLTHVAGTFLVQASGAFLNGAGLGGGEDRNVTVPKTFRDGRGRVPYVSAQAWKRWLRNTLIDETGWPSSDLMAIGWNPKGNASKIAGKLNPVDFAEDDIFGYMRAEKGQGKTGQEETEEEIEQEEEKPKGTKTKAVMRASPFAASLLVSIRREGWQGRDEGFVHLKKFDQKALEAEERKRNAKIDNPCSPLPYTTDFYNTNLQGIFCLDYSRLGVFWNLGDRIELGEEKANRFLKGNKIKVVKDEGKIGQIYEMVDAAKARKERASALFKALAVLHGGAKQAQFGTDVSPKVLILAGLNCGNPIFNNLFKDDAEGPVLKIETLKEIIRDYADRITTPVLLGIRTGYLKNESEVKALDKTEITIGEGDNKKAIEIKVLTPIEASKEIGDMLP